MRSVAYNHCACFQARSLLHLSKDACCFGLFLLCVVCGLFANTTQGVAQWNTFFENRIKNHIKNHIESCINTEFQTALDTTEREKVFVPLEAILPASGTTATTTELKKTPIGALWRTAVLPGWGQLYVESYWKAPLFIAGWGGCLFGVVRQHNLFSQFNTEYNTLSDSARSTPTGQVVLLQREFYRDTRDAFAVGLLAVYLLAAVDAYTGAHLYEFDVSDDVKATVSLLPLQGRVNLALRW